jgi:hypothetical protein
MTIDVQDVLERADLHRLVLIDTELRRAGKELHGPCPLCTCTSQERRHVCDRFRLDAERKHWYCRHCSPQGGNAIDFAIKRYGVPFREACDIALGEQHLAPLAPHLSHAISKSPSLPSQTWQVRGRQLVAEAIASLWSSLGARPRDYLHRRGLIDQTIEAWHLGYIAVNTRLPASDWGLAQEVYVHRGILIPWFTSTGSLTGLKIRKPVPTSVRNKYASISGSTYRLFGTPTLVIDEPLILVEGEFDAIAAWQVLGERSATVALGTARVPDAAELRLLCAARPVLVALDADEKGDEVATKIASLSPNLRRARPPGAKDLSDSMRSGADLLTWFRESTHD